VREQFVELGGGPVAYDDHGGDGPPMLLLHGIGGAKLNWGQLAPYLQPRYHLYALDMPGFGHSPLNGRPAGPRPSVPLVREFIDRVAREPAVLVGHSMGGLTSMLVASAHPEAVRALVLLDPAFPAEPGHKAERSPAEGTPRWLLGAMSRAPRAAALLTPLVVRERNLEHIVRGTIVGACGPGAQIPEDVIQAHLEHERGRRRSPRPYEGYLRAWRDIDYLFAHAAELEAAVRAITSPTLLLHGTVDPVVPPSAARRLSALQPSWPLHWLEGVGHQPLFEVPQTVARLMLDWLPTAGETNPQAPPARTL